MANQLFDVQAYVTDETLPRIEAYSTLTSLANKKFNGWDKTFGVRGAKLNFRKPSQYLAVDTLTPDLTTDWTEEFGTLNVTQEKSVTVNFTDQQRTLYPLDQIGEEIGEGASIEIISAVDEKVANISALSPFRFHGQQDPEADTRIITMAGLRHAMADFRNFGGTVHAHCIIPDFINAEITSDSLQEFTVNRNNEVSKSWELGGVKGIANATFYSSSFLPTHTAGTASAETGITLTSISDSTYVEPNTGETLDCSEIVVGNAATGTFVIGDVGQFTSSTVKFLRPQGHATTNIQPQFKVVSATTAVAGVATVKIFPKMNATATDPQKNISRALVATDPLQIMGSHVIGLVFLDGYLNMAMPKLNSKTPYDSFSQTSDNGVSMRCYYGSTLDSVATVMVHDILFGVTMVPEGAMRILYPLDI